MELTVKHTRARGRAHTYTHTHTSERERETERARAKESERNNTQISPVAYSQQSIKTFLTTFQHQGREQHPRTRR